MRAYGYAYVPNMEHGKPRATKLLSYDDILVAGRSTDPVARERGRRAFIARVRAKCLPLQDRLTAIDLENCCTVYGMDLGRVKKMWRKAVGV